MEQEKQTTQGVELMLGLQNRQLGGYSTVRYIASVVTDLSSFFVNYSNRALMGVNIARPDSCFNC